LSFLGYLAKGDVEVFEDPVFSTWFFGFNPILLYYENLFHLSMLAYVRIYWLEKVSRESWLWLKEYSHILLDGMSECFRDVYHMFDTMFIFAHCWIFKAMKQFLLGFLLWMKTKCFSWAQNQFGTCYMNVICAWLLIMDENQVFLLQSWAWNEFEHATWGEECLSEHVNPRRFHTTTLKCNHNSKPHCWSYVLFSAKISQI
jgi:hypothetical protein